MTMPDSTVVKWLRDNWLILGLCITLGVMYGKINQTSEELKNLSSKFDKRAEGDQLLQVQIQQLKAEISLIQLRIEYIERHETSKREN